MLEDRSSSDEENSNNLLPSPEYEDEIENKDETPTLFGIDLNINENVNPIPAELDDTSSNESESDFADNQSDADEKSLDSFNESDASVNNQIECASESTTHSYSNSLLEDEDDDANDDDIDDDALKSSHLLNDLNNGKFTILEAAQREIMMNLIPFFFLRKLYIGIMQRIRITD